MSTAVSNIAWLPEHDAAVAPLLRRAGVSGIEVAPTRWWEAPAEVTKGEAVAVRRSWEDRGLPVIALQALLFGRPELRLFGTAEERAKLFQYLSAIIRLGGWLGAGALVFGSPRNRLRGGISATEALDIASDFFHKAGAAAEARDTVLCIEPNPSEYGSDFILDGSSGLELVEQVGHPGFGLHLDTGCMTLAGDDPESLLTAASGWLRHFHVSEPHLAPVGRNGAVDHGRFAAALRASGYSGFTSIEMKPAPSDPVGGVSDAVEFVSTVYCEQ